MAWQFDHNLWWLDALELSCIEIVKGLLCKWDIEEFCVCNQSNQLLIFYQPVEPKSNTKGSIHLPTQFYLDYVASKRHNSILFNLKLKTEIIRQPQVLPCMFISLLKNRSSINRLTPKFFPHCWDHTYILSQYYSIWILWFYYISCIN